jgi:hypothetical protein
MNFTAKLKRTSHVYTAWRSANRVSGEVGGAIFRLVPGPDYVSGTLNVTQIGMLRHHSSVVLEATDVAPPVMPVVVAPVVESKMPKYSNRFSTGNQPRTAGGRP